MSTTANSLEGIILQRKGDLIGAYFGPDKEGQEKLWHTSEKLKAAGIKFEIESERTTVLKYESGRQLFGSSIGKPVKIPVIIKLEDSTANAEKFLTHGGIFFGDDALKDITFQQDRTQDRLTISGEQTNRVREICDQLHIGYKTAPDNTELTIEGAHNVCAVALSGGRFNGSYEYLAKHGYQLGR